MKAFSQILLCVLCALCASVSSLAQQATSAQYGQVPITYSCNLSNICNSNQTLVYTIPAYQSTNGYTNAYTVFPLTNNSLAAGTTFVVTNATTPLGSLPINLTKYDEFTVQLTYTQLTNTSGTCTVTANLNCSADSTNWTTWGSITGAATNAVMGPTNWLLLTNVSRTIWGSQGYLQLYSVSNSSTNTATNIYLEIWVKPRRQG